MSPAHDVELARQKVLEAQEALLRYTDSNDRDEERHKRLLQELKNATKDFVDRVERLAERASVLERRQFDHQEVAARNRFVEQLALTDDLTGLPNRRAIEPWATRQLSGAVRHKFLFWAIVADVDRFRFVNDVHGRDAGDAVLKRFAEILKANTRQCDICGRVGDDEFLLIITHAKEDGIRLATERLREQIGAQIFTFGSHQVSITASFGVAGPRRGQYRDFERLMVQADAALHSAKRFGGNRVELVPVEVH
jgi:diguanylate cyclase (GGDEF)-like protein